MKRKTIKLAVILAAFVLLTGIGGSWASYSNTVQIRNPLATEKSGVELVENFNPNSTFLPGETVEKKPFFRNTGELDLILRVKVLENWKDSQGNPVTTNPPDTEKVSKNWTDSWKTDWFLVGDYYYYKHVLKKSGSEGSVTEDILKSLTLSPEVSNDHHDYDYSSLVYELKFTSDAVPADSLSLESWNGQINGENTKGIAFDWKGLLEP